MDKNVTNPAMTKVLYEHDPSRPETRAERMQRKRFEQRTRTASHTRVKNAATRRQPYAPLHNLPMYSQVQHLMQKQESIKERPFRKARQEQFRAQHHVAS